ncbi:MAG: hemerythrin domain-containing protein, partial [Acidimicrobiales bacterium]
MKINGLQTASEVVAHWPGERKDVRDLSPTAKMTSGYPSQVREEHDQLCALFDLVSSPDADRPAALNELVRRMAAHVSAERSFLYWALRRQGGAAAAYAIRLKRDYLDISRPLLAIERRKHNSPDLPALVDLLEEAFQEHCEHMEEAVGALNEDELQPLADRMDSAESFITSHPHPRLLFLGPLSTLTTRWAARIDRARDRALESRQNVTLGLDPGHGPYSSPTSSGWS